MAYGELLRQELLDRPRLGCVNLHASLLPRWRGASPLQAALRAGDAATGVTVMRMVKGLDAGPMYLHETVSLAGRPTLPWLHDALATVAATALNRFLDAPTTIPVEQDPAEVTHCHKLHGDHGRLDWSASQAELDRWVRAYTPAPGCWVPHGSDRIKILGLDPAGPSSLAPGQIGVVGEHLLVGCGDGQVAITRLQLPGKKTVAAADFLRGNKVPERF
jgi:methionyl-tRNA formyltransferase